MHKSGEGVGVGANRRTALSEGEDLALGVCSVPHGKVAVDKLLLDLRPGEIEEGVLHEIAGEAAALQRQHVHELALAGRGKADEHVLEVGQEA